MNTCEYLATVGLATLVAETGGPTPIVWDEDAPENAPGGYREAERNARLADMARVRAMILDAERAAPRTGDLSGAKWLGRVISWPDRVPGLKTWGGRVTLAGLIRDRVAALRADKGATPDLFAVRGLLAGHTSPKVKALRTKQGKARRLAGAIDTGVAPVAEADVDPDADPVISAATGWDALTCQRAIDIGFSPVALGMDITFRPALELLACVGLEAVPLVSFEARVCGFAHAGKVWRFPVLDRDGGYAKTWGDCQPVA